MSAHPARHPGIMIVDDDPIQLQILSALIGALGHGDPRIAGDGEEALAMLAADPGGVALLVCDLAMPSMDGIEFLRHLAARGYEGEVILLSGVEPDVLRAAENLGRIHGLRVIGAIAKPVHIEALQEILNRVAAPRPLHDSPCGLVDATRAEVLAALDSGAITAWYMPCVELDSCRVTALRALARWEHHELGVLQPSQFIPRLEALDLVEAFSFAMAGRVVAHQVALVARGWRLPIGINMHLASMLSPDAPERLHKLLDAAGLSPADIVLELDESKLTGDMSASVEVLTRMRIKGFGLGIDNFGTGHSSIESLFRLSFSEILFGPNLIRGASLDATMFEILSHSVALGRTLGLRTVGVGIESQSDWELARRMRCEHGCGFFVARAMPPVDLLAWLGAREGEPAPSVTSAPGLRPWVARRRTDCLRENFIQPRPGLADNASIGGPER